MITACSSAGAQRVTSYWNRAIAERSWHAARSRRSPCRAGYPVAFARSDRRRRPSRANRRPSRTPAPLDAVEVFDGVEVRVERPRRVRSPSDLLAPPHRRRARRPRTRAGHGRGSHGRWRPGRLGRRGVAAAEQPRAGSRRRRAGHRGQRDLRHLRGADDPAAVAPPRRARPRRDRRRGCDEARRPSPRPARDHTRHRAARRARRLARRSRVPELGVPRGERGGRDARERLDEPAVEARALGRGRGARAAACALVRDRRARRRPRDRGRRRRRIAGARRVRRAEPGARFGSARRRAPIDHPRSARRSARPAGTRNRSRIAPRRPATGRCS